MPQYLGTVRDLCYRQIIVEADSVEEATEMVQEAEADEFKLVDGGEWFVESVRELTGDRI